jgi:putative membrane protein
MSPREPSPSPPSPAARRVSEHLANERTFLAWVRTCLGLIGLGFVLARMGLFLRQLALLGAIAPRRGLHAGQEFLLVGVVFLLLGTGLGGWSGWLYRRTCRAINAGQFEPAQGTAVALTVTIVLGGLLIVGLVLWRTLVQG